MMVRLPVRSDQAAGPGAATHMPHGKDIVECAALAQQQEFPHCHLLHTDSLNLVNEVTNYPVKSECNIWNTLILLKNLSIWEFDFISVLVRGAAITKYHRPGGLKYTFISHGSGG